MKCNKCGTPIIPGEDTCRICGNKTDFSKRAIDAEVIDFPEEVESKPNEEKAFELPDLENIVEIEDLGEKEIFKKNSDEKKEEVSLSPQETEVKNDVNDVKLEPTLVIDSSTPKPEVKEVIDIKTEDAEEKSTKKVAEKKVAYRPTKKVKEEKNIKAESHSNNVGIVFLTLLLICSLAGNIVLFIINGNAKAAEKSPEEEKVVYSKVSYSNYKITIPSTWINEGSDKLILYDESQNWSARMQVVADADYDTFVENKDRLIEELSPLKYQFTSNYFKKIDNQEYYLFKGKYYNYSVYVILTSIGKEKMLVTDLKFKGEVDDVLLNSILSVMGEIKENNTQELFKDNFEFQDLSEKVMVVSQKQS